MPCYAHVLHDVATSLRLTDEFTDGRVGLNLDPAFLISPTNYSKRHQILPRIATVLAPGAAIISLSDILVRDTTMSYPAIGSGGIDFKSLIATLTENADQNAVWVLNAHPLWGVDELASIKNRVVSMLQTDLTEAGSSEPEA
jgi:sugar phosphate isomerase/epimerase